MIDALAKEQPTIEKSQSAEQNFYDWWSKKSITDFFIYHQ
jgi:hypothetical protein